MRQDKENVPKINLWLGKVAYGLIRSEGARMGQARLVGIWHGKDNKPKINFRVWLGEVWYDRVRFGDAR